METPADTVCPRCHGTGQAPGVDEKACDLCGGSGRISVENLPPGSDPYAS
jgi:DnaJ-class molecular chaperone